MSSATFLLDCLSVVLFRRSLSATAAELRPPPPPSLASSIDDDEAMDLLLPAFLADILAGCWKADVTVARRSWNRRVIMAVQDIFMFCGAAIIITCCTLTTTIIISHG